MKFVCSFAWADLEIRDEERDYVKRLIDRLELDADERTRVRSWLEVPPDLESIDPTLVPHAHRQLFVDEIKGVIEADGEISPEESENLQIFEALVG
jgi:hypothetical protein